MYSWQASGLPPRATSSCWPASSDEQAVVGRSWAGRGPTLARPLSLRHFRIRDSGRWRRVLRALRWLSWLAAAHASAVPGGRRRASHVLFAPWERPSAALI